MTSFSTPSERDTLIDCFSREVLPEDIRTDRIDRVFRMMNKLYSRIARIDPKMVQHVGPRRPYIKYFFSPELLEIKKIDHSSKKTMMEILAYSVEPEFVSRYIQQYETNHSKTASFLGPNSIYGFIKPNPGSGFGLVYPK